MTKEAEYIDLPIVIVNKADLPITSFIGVPAYAAVFPLPADNVEIFVRVKKK